MEREARYNHYVSSLQFYNLSKLDDMFRQRVMYVSGLRLVELQPEVAAGKLLQLLWSAFGRAFSKHP
jgi:hypothetical protein